MAHGKSDPLLREGATKAIGVRLKWCRKQHWHRVYQGEHPTQAELAKLIGIGDSTVTKHEGGVNAPNAVLAIKYGRYYKVDPGWILCGAATDRACWPSDWVEEPARDTDTGRTIQARQMTPTRATPPAPTPARRASEGGGRR